MLEFLLIAAVGLLVGVINGMAGGASVISFPVLLATGISPVSAAMTNAIGVTPANFFAYRELFDSLDLDMFELMSTITVDDVFRSDLKMNLAVFPQARSYSNGGSINNIKEGNFTVKNLLGSMLKEFVLQYQSHIDNASTILLVGGIAKKIKILPELFQIYNPSKEFIVVEEGVESTHKGMIKYINKWMA